jgi:N-acetylated-alpha-linked acidic dipeptidase
VEIEDQEEKTMTAPTSWSDAKSEGLLREEASIDEAWGLIERFSTLVRESGSEDEWTAAAYISSRLDALGVRHELHDPELFLSIPKRARLSVQAGGETRELKAKTPAFSVSTGDEAIEGELLYVPTEQATGVSDLFGADPEIPEGIEGKIVLTEGNPLPGKVAAFAKAGVRAMVYVGPGENIHEGIITPIWGAPDLDNAGWQPEMTVLAINRPEGEWLVGQCKNGRVEVSLNTWLEEGWMRCPLVEATIPGNEEPDRYVLLHGHIDSWHVGIGDNATGDATLLEVARLMHERRGELRRGVKICWWPGHSTGRYAGSTWYADNFALDLDANCVAHINCDSPGCRWATVYENIMWMAEADDVARGAIADSAGQPAERIRPIRAGDISFNNLGISTLYMLSSTMPRELLDEKGYYTVGGCGGNIEWHTEDDTLEIADREILQKDIEIYATAVWRVANAPLLPLDYRRTVDELVSYLKDYEKAAAGRVSFDVVLKSAARTKASLEDLYGRSEEADKEELDVINEALLRAGRRLVSVGFSERGKFRQDSALKVPPIPSVAPAQGLSVLTEGSHQDRVVRTHVVRGLNEVAFHLAEARRECEIALREIG